MIAITTKAALSFACAALAGAVTPPLVVAASPKARHYVARRLSPPARPQPRVAPAAVDREPCEIFTGPQLLITPGVLEPMQPPPILIGTAPGPTTGPGSVTIGTPGLIDEGGFAVLPLPPPPILNSVPEPTTWALMAVGLFGVGVVMRWRVMAARPSI